MNGITISFLFYSSRLFFHQAVHLTMITLFASTTMDCWKLFLDECIYCVAVVAGVLFVCNGENDFHVYPLRTKREKPSGYSLVGSSVFVLLFSASQSTAMVRVPFSGSTDFLRMRLLPSSRIKPASRASRLPTVAKYAVMCPPFPFRGVSLICFYAPFLQSGKRSVRR